MSVKGFEVHSERCKTNLKSLGRDTVVAASEEWGRDVGPSPEIHRLPFLAHGRVSAALSTGTLSGLGWLWELT